MPKRVLWVAGAALVLAALAAYVVLPDRGGSAGEEARSQDAMADELGAQIMEHLYRGHVPGRSAEIMLVPTPHSFLVTQWPLTTLGTDTPYLSTSHPNPWNYLTRVPIVLNGPGYLPEATTINRPTDIASLAPTYGAILGVDMPETDGAPWPEIVEPAGDRKPKAIVTVVIDGGGWNTLQEHPDAWPAIKYLMQTGTTFTNATIGSAPSITGALHATFGTGDYPIHHGLPGNQMRRADGTNVDTWLQNADPRFLRTPAISELWDEQNDNKPFVGTVSYEGWHLGMIGHGAQREGGDRDVAALWEIEDEAWWVNEDYYELPSYLESTDALSAYEVELDERDGLTDGTWFGNAIDELRDPDTASRPGTPAFVRLTGQAVIDVMRHEKVGKDSLTDMLWVEFKAPDFAGHIWNVESPEEEDVLRETDNQIARIKKELVKTAGERNYILAISADHGQQPLPDNHGGWRISSNELERDIEDEFGADVIEKISPVDIYVNSDKMSEADVSLEDLTGFISKYTIGDNIPEGFPGADRVPEGRLDEQLFVGAFTTDYLKSLTQDRIESFGDSDYEEGDFFVKKVKDQT